MGRHQQPHQTQVFVSFFVTGCTNANTHGWPATTDPRRRIFITSSPNGSNRFITLEWSVWGGGTVDDDSDSRLVSLATHVSKLWRRLSVQLSLYTRFVLLSECHTRLVYRRPSSFAWAVGHRRTKPRRTYLRGVGCLARPRAQGRPRLLPPLLPAAPVAQLALLLVAMGTVKCQESAFQEKKQVSLTITKIAVSFNFWSCMLLDEQGCFNPIYSAVRKPEQFDLNCLFLKHEICSNGTCKKV